MSNNERSGQSLVPYEDHAQEKGVRSLVARAVEISAKNPADIVKAGYRADQNFRIARQEAMEEKDPEAKASAYLVVARSLLLAGKNPDSFLNLAHASIGEISANIHPLSYDQWSSWDYSGARDEYRSGLDKVGEFLYELAGLTIERVGSAPDIVKEIYDNIKRYDDELKPGTNVNDNKERIKTNIYLDFELIKLTELSRFGEFILQNSESSLEISAERIIKEMKAMLSKNNFFGNLSSRRATEALFQLAKLQVYSGNLEEGQTTLETIQNVQYEEQNEFKNDGSKRLDWTTKFDFPLLKKIKIQAGCLAAVVQYQLARTYPASNLSESQIKEIVDSGNLEGLTALGYVLDTDAISELLNTGVKPYSDEEAAVIKGVEEKVRAQRQEADTKLALLEARRAEIKKFTEEAFGSGGSRDRELVLMFLKKLSNS